MSITLRFDNGETFREGEFPDSQEVTIGREPDNAVHMPLGVLSRHHAKVAFENGQWHVVDLDSANGSFYRGKQLAPNVKTPLVNGDIVHFGTVAMSIAWSTPAPPPEVKVVEKVVEKIVEKPVEKIVERVVEKPVVGATAAKPVERVLNLPDDVQRETTSRVIRI